MKLERGRKKYFPLLPIFMLAILFMLKSFPVSICWAEWNVGGGMEYFTVKTLVNDKDGNYYHSLIQSTIAVAQLDFAQNPWLFKINAGLSDWNVSGGWQGTDIGAVSTEPFYWAWQQKFELECNYALWTVWLIGLRFSDHVFEHYDGLTHYRFLKYRIRSWDIIFGWEALKTENVRVDLSVAYAPLVLTEFYQNINFIVYDLLVAEYDSAGKGTRWQGRVKMGYRDSAGWGLDLIYQFGWLEVAKPHNLSGLTIKTGSLSGYFLLRF